MISFSNKIENIDELVSAAIIASLLEVSATPKPGNVHRLRDFENTKYEHFLCANTVIAKPLKQIALGKPIGENLLEAVKITNKWQKGGNINFGILLLFAPIIAAAGEMLMNDQDVSKIDELMKNIRHKIENSTPEDSINLYEAIEIVQPGGLGTVSKLDVNNKESINKIKQENLNLKAIFHTCASWDNIASEWITNYKISREIGLSYYVKLVQASQDLNYSIILTFLRILSEYPDTLIIRKTNLKTAKMISERARIILSIKDKMNQINEIKKFDDYLYEYKGKYNPGTTADLVATTLFLAMLKGLCF